MKRHRQDRPGDAGRLSIRKCAPLGVLVALLVLFFASGLGHYASFETLRQNRADLVRFVATDAAAAAMLYTFGYAVITACSLPVGTLVTVAGGFLFGAALATVYTVIGATLGATALFLAARSGLGGWLEAKAGPFMHKMEAGFREDAMSYLLVLRLVPLFPFWLVNLVPAFLGVPLRTYVVGTFVGIIPGTLVFALVGSGLGAVLDAGERPRLDTILEPRILLALIGLAVLALIPVVYKKLKSRKV